MTIECFKVIEQLKRLEKIAPLSLKNLVAYISNLPYFKDVSKAEFAEIFAKRTRTKAQSKKTKEIPVDGDRFYVGDLKLTNVKVNKKTEYKSVLRRVPAI